ncbi:MAG TPA: pseudouridine synthase [bacterium]|jgi:pseudouridine synthase
MMERLQKILASRGIASRREAETLILKGRVSVNGVKVTELGAKADPDADTILFDGRTLPNHLAPKVLMLNKPVGYLSTSRKSREEGEIVLDLVPSDRRYFPVGRLDRDSSGLLLMTDDGDLALRLTHPRYGAHKTYVVETTATVPPESVRLLKEGVMLEDGMAYAIDALQLGRRCLQITLGEGRKRQVRRMIAALGLRVFSLERVQIGGLSLGSLRPGQWRELNPDEIERLLQPAADNHPR